MYREVTSLKSGESFGSAARACQIADRRPARARCEIGPPVSRRGCDGGAATIRAGRRGDEGDDPSGIDCREGRFGVKKGIRVIGALRRCSGRPLITPSASSPLNRRHPSRHSRCMQLQCSSTSGAFLQ